jgi:hypothetical protein
MAEEIKIWQVENGARLTEVNRSKLDFEERLENWLNEDISILSAELLIIGRQVETDYGKYIDLLCINPNGDLVIVELKKDKTPREVTAQVLDYASWVKDLSHERILNLSNLYLAKKNTNLEEGFQKKFGVELPEVLNSSHAMLIVASEIDESTERIIKYLSDSHGVNINVAQFQYFKNQNGQEFLARIFLIEQSEVEQKAQSKATNKRAPRLSLQELEQIAENNGVGNLFSKIVDGLDGKFIKRAGRTMLRFKGKFESSNKVVFNLVPERSDTERGLHFQIYLLKFAECTSLSEEAVLNLLPSNRETWKYYEGADETYSGYKGFFVSDDEVEKFLSGLENVIKH